MIIQSIDMFSLHSAYALVYLYIRSKQYKASVFYTASNNESSTYYLLKLDAYGFIAGIVMLDSNYQY